MAWTGDDAAGRPEANEITRFAAGSRATAHVSRTAAVPVKA